METTRTQQTLTWQITGMHCTSCSILIDEAVQDLNGVTTSHTSLKTQRTTVTFDATQCDADQITTTIVKAGYTASPATDDPPTTRRSWFRRTTT